MLNQEVLLAQSLSEELNVSIENVNVFENGSVISDDLIFPNLFGQHQQILPCQLLRLPT